MSWLWDSPFNKVVRSTEALAVGILVGIVMGALIMFFVPVSVHNQELTEAIKLCNDIDNVKVIRVTPTRDLINVECYTNVSELKKPD